jgi:hypothetical protein
MPLKPSQFSERHHWGRHKRDVARNVTPSQHNNDRGSGKPCEDETMGRERRHATFNPSAAGVTRLGSFACLDPRVGTIASWHWTSFRSLTSTDAERKSRRSRYRAAPRRCARLRRGSSVVHAEAMLKHRSRSSCWREFAVGHCAHRFHRPVRRQSVFEPLTKALRT